MVSELIQVAVLVAQTAPAASSESELVSILERFVLPVLTGAGAFWLSRLQARKEQQTAQATIEETTRKQLLGQQEGLIREYQSMTAETRKILADAYRDAAEHAVARRAAEMKAANLEQELTGLRSRCQVLVDRVEELERSARRKRPGG